MHTIQESTLEQPPVSFFIDSFSIQKIRRELASFGLNPFDWCAVKTRGPHLPTMTLVHREDRDLRLCVKIDERATSHATSCSTSDQRRWIKDIEMRVI